jgi:hypothetical protein
LIRTWLELPEVHRDCGQWRDLDGAWFRMRTEELTWRIQMATPNRIKQRDVAPLLSLPTHRDGWIDPVVFVQRLEAYANSISGYDAPNLDLAQALLRLTPDGRDEALPMLSEKERSDPDSPICFALGADVALRVSSEYGGGALALAAAHARAVIDDAVQDRLPFTLPVARLDEQGNSKFFGPIADDPAMPGDLLSKAHCLLEVPEAWGRAPDKRDWLVQWQNLTWPADRRPLCLSASLTSASPYYLCNLLDPDTSWGAEACRLAAWAIGTSQPLAKGLITDALIDAIAGRAVDPIMLARQLATVLPHLKLNRVAAVLDETSRISLLHHWSVCLTLETVVAQLDETPRDLHHLLAVLLESATVTGRALNDVACAVLNNITGSSKTAKLAKQLLALKPNLQHMQTVRQAALEAALAKAERWQAIAAACWSGA